jgi:hypothetical protein
LFHPSQHVPSSDSPVGFCSRKQAACTLILWEGPRNLFKRTTSVVPREEEHLKKKKKKKR